MKSTSKKDNYRCLPHNPIKCWSHWHRGFKSRNHNKSTIDLKGGRIVMNVVYMDRKWKQQGVSTGKPQASLNALLVVFPSIVYSSTIANTYTVRLELTQTGKFPRKIRTKENSENKIKVVSMKTSSNLINRNMSYPSL